MRTNQWRRGILIGISLVVAFWFFSLSWGLMGKMKIAITTANETKRQYQAIETRKSLLEANVAELNTARGQDSAIRTAFGVARPGEELVIVVAPVATSSTTTLSWWQKILHWF